LSFPVGGWPRLSGIPRSDPEKYGVAAERRPGAEVEKQVERAVVAAVGLEPLPEAPAGATRPALVAATTALASSTFVSSLAAAGRRVRRCQHRANS